MTLRKKKIIFIQLSLFLVGLLIIFLTYLNFENNSTGKIIKEDLKIKIDNQIKNEKREGNIFYNIKYTGLDLSGNRYILRAEEAESNQNVEGLLKLKSVEATFYFKNDKILNISSNSGFYNNQTLDMIFENKVEGSYEGSNLYAEKAEYFNSKNILIITDDVKVKDPKGTITAEKLLFDIEKNTLNINSSNSKKINANINYK